MDVFSPGRHIGLGGDTGGANWSFAGGLFGQGSDEIDDAKDFETADNEGYGLVARATFAPINRDGAVLHFGASARRGTPDSETDKSDGVSDVVRYRTRAETTISKVRFLDTGRVLGVDWIDSYGIEAAASLGPVTFQSEYTGTHLDRSGSPSADFQSANLSGYYGQIAWLITGEAPAYRGREGEFGRITPSRKSGAWELAYRYSGIDLDDAGADIEGGTSVQQTFGLNWHANSAVKVMFNYSLVENGVNADADGDTDGDEHFSFLQLRCQVSL